MTCRLLTSYVLLLHMSLFNSSAPHPPSSGRRWWSSSPLISILLLVGTLLLIAKWQPGGLSSSQSLQGHLLEHLPSFSTPALPPTKHLRLYIYELPDTLSSAPARSTTEEDASSSDVWMHEFLSTAPFRTYDPAEATVFYVPIFPDHHLKQGLAMYGDSAKAHTATTQYIQDALTHIKTQHPYWSAHNGRDHLTTFTSPLGRCLHFAGLNEADFGEMFVFQPLGDLVLANGDEQVHAVAGEYLTRTEAPQTQKWPCYRKDWDIVLPVYLSETDVPSVDSQDGERPRLALYRFERLRHEFSQKYMRVGIKHDLHAQFDRAPLAGADWKANDEQGTLQDLAEAVTCVTPPDGYVSRVVALQDGHALPVSLLAGDRL